MAAPAPNEVASRAEHKRMFQQFLRAEDPSSPYGIRIGKMIEQVGQRLLVNVNDLRDYNAEYTARVLERPLELVPIMEEAIKEVVVDRSPGFFGALAEKNRSQRVAGSEKTDRIYIGFEGNFGASSVTPRTVGADNVSRLVSVEGIVTRCALVRPKLVKTVHYCPATVSKCFHCI
jgi:DNA replication licensing factor MCM3